jgi:hypothetical protein
MTVSLSGKSTIVHAYNCVNHTTNETDSGIWPNFDMVSLMAAIGPRMSGNSECYIIKTPSSMDESLVRMRHWNEYFGLGPNEELDKKKKESLDECIAKPELAKCQQNTKRTPQDEKVIKNIESIYQNPSSLDAKIEKIFKDYEKEIQDKRLSDAEKKQSQALISQYKNRVAGLLKTYATDISYAQIADNNYAREQTKRAEASRLKREAEMAQARYEEAKNSGPNSSACQKWQKLNQAGNQVSGMLSYGGYDTSMLDQGLQLSQAGAAVCQFVDQPTIDSFLQMAQQSQRAYEAYQHPGSNSIQSNTSSDSYSAKDTNSYQNESCTCYCTSTFDGETRTTNQGNMSNPTNCSNLCNVRPGVNKSSSCSK